MLAGSRGNAADVAAPPRRLLYALVGGRIPVVAVDVMQVRGQRRERRLIDAAVLRQAVARALAELSSVQPSRATPTIGMSRSPRRVSACSAGKIFLYARSPVAPKKTNASDLDTVMRSPGSYPAGGSTNLGDGSPSRQRFGGGSRHLSESSCVASSPRALSKPIAQPCLSPAERRLN